MFQLKEIKKDELEATHIYEGYGHILKIEYIFSMPKDFMNMRVRLYKIDGKAPGNIEVGFDCDYNMCLTTPMPLHLSINSIEEMEKYLHLIKSIAGEIEELRKEVECLYG